MSMTKSEIITYLKKKKNHYDEKYGIKFIGLFGSFSREEANEQSDIDLLYTVDKDKKVSLFQYLKIVSQLENDFHKKVDLVRDETLKPSLRSYVDRDLIYV